MEEVCYYSMAILFIALQSRHSDGVAKKFASELLLHITKIRRAAVSIYSQMHRPAFKKSYRGLHRRLVVTNPQSLPKKVTDGGEDFRPPWVYACSRLIMYGIIPGISFSSYMEPLKFLISYTYFQWLDFTLSSFTTSVNVNMYFNQLVNQLYNFVVLFEILIISC